MIRPAPTTPSLRLCNSLLMGNERREMVRAARLAFMDEYEEAEEIRENLGYGAEDCHYDVNKTERISR